MTLGDSSKSQGYMMVEPENFRAWEGATRSAGSSILHFEKEERTPTETRTYTHLQSLSRGPK